MKSIFKSKTAWGAVIAALPSLARAWGVDLSESEVATVSAAFMEIFGFVFVIYGRISARVPVTLGKVKGDPINLVAVLFIAGCMAFASLFSGCAAVERYEAWSVENPAASRMIESTARAVLIAVVNEQASSNEDIAEHVDLIRSGVEVAFDRGRDEAEVAALIGQTIDSLFPGEAEARAVLAAEFRAALLDPDSHGATPASDGTRVRMALLAGHLTERMR
jgi:hypothetical protein